MNKRRLYENIMRNVAHTVKRTLLENDESDKMYKPTDARELYNIIDEYIKKSDNGELNLNNIDVSAISNLSYIISDNKTIKHIDISKWNIKSGADLSGAFMNDTALQSIKLPENLTKISESMFLGCTSLKTINIPDTVKTIENSAFYRCTSLKTINIPNSVETIEFSAFLGCTSLKSVNCPLRLYEIDDYTFGGCINLTVINFPKTLERIGKLAFAGTGFTSIEIPWSVERIDKRAFYSCKELYDVKLSQRTEVSDDAFLNTPFGLKMKLKSKR